MTPQLSACTSQTIAGRRRKAFRFAQAFDEVHALADDANDIIDVCVTLAVHAGIAASDVICCSTLGYHSQTRDHHDAIGLLRKSDGRLHPHIDEPTSGSQGVRDCLHFMDVPWKSLCSNCDRLLATFELPERNGDHMKTRTKIAASGLVIAALAATATPAFAHARNGNTSSPATSTTATTAPAPRGHMGEFAALVAAGTITQAQADAFEAAERAGMDAARTAGTAPDHAAIVKAALAKLVSAGTLTQTQSDAIAAVEAAHPMPVGRPQDDRAPGHALAALISAGTLTQAQADAFEAAERTAMDAERAAATSSTRPDHAAIVKTVTDKLVAAGTITRAQADAIVTAEANHPMPPAGDDRGMGHGHRGGPMGAPGARTPAPSASATSA